VDGGWENIIGTGATLARPSAATGTKVLLEEWLIRAGKRDNSSTSASAFEW
jgi:hypothetical protein